MPRRRKQKGGGLFDGLLNFFGKKDENGAPAPVPPPVIKKDENGAPAPAVPAPVVKKDENGAPAPVVPPQKNGDERYNGDAISIKYVNGSIAEITYNTAAIEGVEAEGEMQPPSEIKTIRFKPTMGGKKKRTRTTRKK